MRRISVSFEGCLFCGRLSSAVQAWIVSSLSGYFLDQVNLFTSSEEQKRREDQKTCRPRAAISVSVDNPSLVRSDHDIYSRTCNPILASYPPLQDGPFPAETLGVCYIGRTAPMEPNITRRKPPAFTFLSGTLSFGGPGLRIAPHLCCPAMRKFQQHQRNRIELSTD